MSEPLTIAEYREERRKMRKVMRELLDCYWGRGDGDEAPEFIQRAAALSGWKAPAGSLKGTSKGK